MNFDFEQEKENLDKFGKNLTDLALKNKLDPVINRDEEIRRIIRILSRKTKNNPILVGEPGVGKTAIIEGLARKIIEGQVPEDLKDVEIWELDLTSLVAGAVYRGQFEERLKKILKKIEDSNGKIIVFIDEIHMLIGAGETGGDGSMDAANILKPMMARGQIKLIGATTFEEYRKYIEKDAALERRMQKVDVLEPNIEDTITILRGIKERFEQFHKVKIEDGALIAAANLSSRYITDRFLPDKAIDLIDEAAARIKVEMNYQPEKLENAQQLLAKLEMEKIALSQEKENTEKVKLINEKIETIKNEINEIKSQWNQEKEHVNLLSEYKEKIDNLKNQQILLMNEGKYKEASEILYVQIPQIENKIKSLEEKSNKKENIIQEIVSEEEIAQIISKWTKIPVNKLMEKQREKILNLENHLKEKVKGQNEAIQLVSQTIMRSKANINDPDKPIGSFIFMGPTGVGKTELARAMAFNLFDSENQMIRLDMSEYMEKHDVSKLIGSPPGYVGFDQGGQLTEKVRQNPFSIILFDEIEKAHPDVVNVLLQVLDNGSLTDSRGRKINFRNTIIILTSNIASEEIIKNSKIDNNQLKQILLKHFKPEFINRIDEIIAFNPLDKKVVEEIIKLELSNLENRLLKTHKISLNYNFELLQWIIDNAYDKFFGARPIKRFIKKEIESQIAHAIISNKINDGDKISLTLKDNVLIIEK